MAELDTEEERLEFKWGKKKGIGGKKKDVQFYDSFTFDGEEYKLFDDVYLHNEGEGDPYIGKLIKIWENPDKSKKVKIQWFYHPTDIRDFLEGYEPRNNELFLACGEGIGFADINPVNKSHNLMEHDGFSPMGSLQLELAWKILQPWLKMKILIHLLLVTLS